MLNSVSVCYMFNSPPIGIEVKEGKREEENGAGYILYILKYKYHSLYSQPHFYFK